MPGYMRRLRLGLTVPELDVRVSEGTSVSAASGTAPFVVRAVPTGVVGRRGVGAGFGAEGGRVEPPRGAVWTGVLFPIFSSINTTSGLATKIEE